MSRATYCLLIGAVALERLLELALSARNLRRAERRGAVVVGQRDYRWMVALHALLLAACVVEVQVLKRPWIRAVGVPMLVVAAGSMGLRYWVVVTLGDRWTTRVAYVPGDPLVATGPFRFMRHPNYAAVAAEVAALPLIHGAWLTALGFSLANAVVLRRRISLENDVLRRLASPPIGGGA